MTAFNATTGATTAGNTGEKVLASPLLFSDVVYFSTYEPSRVVSADPCQPGNLGTARLYAVDYKTGEAALNYYTGNDSTSTTNIRASSTSGVVKLRTDRSIDVGSGIPPDLVISKPKDGELGGTLSSGGGVVKVDVKKGGVIKTLFWRQK